MSVSASTNDSMLSTLAGRVDRTSLMLENPNSTSEALALCGEHDNRDTIVSALGELEKPARRQAHRRAGEGGLTRT